MKKILKILGISMATILVLGVITLLIKGPSDVIVLTPEEEAKQQTEEISQYKNVDLSGFKATTITGEKVSSDIFKDYDITMINLWETTCGPCIEEMPDIAKLYKNKPKGSNIISICVGLEENKKDVSFANKVMRNSDAEFLTLIPDPILKKALTDNVRIFPTTIFVDKNCKTIGTPHFGGHTSEDYKKAIIDRLKLVNSAN